MRAAASAAGRAAAADAGGEMRRGAAPGSPGTAPRVLQEPGSTLDFSPGLRPLRVVLADLAPVVAAIGLRRLPVVDLVEVVLVVRMEDRAVVLVGRELACLLGGRRLAEVLGRGGVRLRRDDVVHPQVHAV